MGVLVNRWEVPLMDAVGKGRDLSTSQHLCHLCTDDPNNPYYGDTHNGLAKLMDTWISVSGGMGA